MFDKRIAAYQNDLLSTHYTEVEHMYRQMRGWKHDYRNHIQIIRGFASAGDTNSIINYVDELDIDLMMIDATIKTGNRMTDTILSSKISLARSKSIDVTVDANISLELKTSQLDLCIIIGNLMDNAIEACMELPEEERSIRIYMEMKQTQLYMSFTNTASSEKKNKVSGRFLSTKGENHGFGLVRIDSIIERYNGYISRNSEAGAFTTEILLPQ